MNPDAEKLVEENIKFAYYMANQYPVLDPHETLSAAMQGLWDAAKKFKPELGFEFCTFARVAIRNRLNTVYEKTCRRMETDFLDTVIIDEPLHDALPVLKSSIPDNALLQREIFYEVNQAIERLETRSRIIIRTVFGFEGHRPKEQGLLRKLGKTFSISGERIGQIRNEAIRQLRVELIFISV